ncbi:type II secretion system protein GspL [Sandarakinorhabdus sp.]|uniref:type II secretion system protein GspL n=1 Tax=Sandarakinorhabdus sp. TaxID=1916663 RepID=UPI003F70A45B
MILVHLAPAVRWQRWGDGRLVASAQGWPTADPTVPLVLAVPGEDIALHWLDLPDLAPAQAAAAARLALADRLAETDPHIAVAPGAGPRAVGVVSRAVMAGWLAELARNGLAASRIIPDPLLLPVPATGWAVARDGARVLARSADAAFAAEADLAAALIGNDPVAEVSPASPTPDALNLLVGDFATITRWQAPAGLWKRWALLAAAIAGLWLAGDVAALVQARAAASAADAETLALARPLLPAGADDEAAALAGLQAVARQRGADGGLAALAAPVVQALAQRPGAGLGSLTYTPAGGLVAGVAGGPDEAQALASALAPNGLAISIGTTRATPDTSITDVTVRR